MLLFVSFNTNLMNEDFYFEKTCFPSSLCFLTDVCKVMAAVLEADSTFRFCFCVCSGLSKPLDSLTFNWQNLEQ